MDLLFADFETKATEDLFETGAGKYAKHPATDWLCLGFAINREPARLIVNGEPLPLDVRRHVEAGGVVIAHNAPFEMAIWNHVCVPRYGWPPLKTEQVHCTMALGYSLGLPGKLENVAIALQLNFQKDTKGHGTMLRVSRPRSIKDGTVIWWTPEDSPEKFDILYKYCLMDVDVERELYFRLKQLSDYERKLWVLDRKINERGIQIDIEAVNRAIQLVDYEADLLDKKMRQVTLNQVASCKAFKQLADWITRQGVALPKNNKTGNDSVDKTSCLILLDRKDLPKAVREAIELKVAAAKTSTAKLMAMRSRIEEDGRVRNTLQFHAAATGRWAGRGVQIQNLPRPNIKPKMIEEFFKILKGNAA